MLQKLPVKIVALSPNGLAGIVVHDKFWDPQGYRAVYISFEVEAAKGEVAEKILVNAVEWVKKWKYKDVTELLGNIVRVPKDVASRFRDTVAKAPGEKIFEDGVLLNEEGGTEIELNTISGRLHLVVAHPTTDVISIGIVKGFARIINITKADNRVTYAVIEVGKPGTIVLSLRASSDASLNSAYVSARQEVLAPTPAPTPTPTPATVTATITTTITTTYITTHTITVPTIVTTTYITTTTISTVYTTTIRVYETITVVEHETITTTSITTVPTEKTVEKTATLTVTTLTTVYERVVDWGTTIPMAVILLVIGIVIGYLVKRR